MLADPVTLIALRCKWQAAYCLESFASMSPAALLRAGCCEMDAILLKGPSRRLAAVVLEEFGKELGPGQDEASVRPFPLLTHRILLLMTDAAVS